jgi:predicted ATPase/class 3 adenylate cyclase
MSEHQDLLGRRGGTAEPAPFVQGFQIKEQLYISRQSIVHRAVRDSDRLSVILKVLRSERPGPAQLARYRNEFAINQDVELPGVARAIELRRQGNGLLIVYEDFGATSIAALLRERDLALAEFFAIAAQIVETLGHLHRADIIHKDISSANLVLNPGTGEVKLIDFGIATRFKAGRPPLRSPFVIEGTLATMSPEQTGRMNRLLDHRTDFYSLGATFYEMLTRQPPFDADDPLELIHCHLAREPVPAHRRNPNVPLPLSKIIAKLLAKRAEDRYQSAAGLLIDVEAVRTARRLDRFEPGRRDRSDRFEIPQKLYGREAQVERLLACFERVRLGKAEMMTVTGPAGVGKSALIREVHKPITRARGSFMAGKFDQLGRSLPYSGLLAALRDQVRHLLTEPEAALADWRAELNAALAPNAQLVVDVCPELGLVIGPQPPVVDLDPRESANRFNRAIANLLRALCAHGSAVVLVLDDLQWADQATLDLLRFVLSAPDIGGLLVIGAWRDNEVGALHPLALMLNELREAGGAVNGLTVECLGFADVGRMLSDTLQSDASQVTALARLALQKTQGNPLFVRQFLHTLHHEGLIRPAPLAVDQGQRWLWDLHEIRAANITDNVVDLLLDRLKRLPEETQHALRCAACIGNRFDIDTLALILKETPERSFDILRPAVQEQLIELRSDLVISDEEDVFSSVLVRQFAFQHDRVQQAAYELLDPAERPQTHVAIGRRLRATLSPDSLRGQVFEVVEHLNRGRALITDAAERLDLAELNMEACRKAALSAAYAAALSYVNIALPLLEDDSWNTQYEATYEAFQQRAVLEYVNGNYATSEAAIEIAVCHARSDIERAQMLFPRIQQQTLLGRFAEAIETACDALRLLDVDLRLDTLEQDTRDAFAIVMEKLAAYNLGALLDWPDTDSQKILLAQRCLRHLGIAAFVAKQDMWPLIVLTSVRLSLDHGNAPESAKTYANYGMLLGTGFGRYQEGFAFGELALHLSERTAGRSMRATVCLTIGSELMPWVRHVRHSARLVEEGYRSGLEAGDILWAGYLVMYEVMLEAFGGKPLDRLLGGIGAQMEFTQRSGNTGATAGIRAYQLVLTRLAEPGGIGAQEAAVPEEDAFLQACRDGHLSMALCFFKILKAQALYLLGYPRQALQATRDIEGMLSYIVNHPCLADRLLYQSLSLAALWQGPDRTEGRAEMEQMRANLAQLTVWSDSCADNFAAKRCMVEAEMARISGDDATAARLYDQAIDAAHAAEFLQDEALANELAARFELGRRPTARVGAMFLRDAVNAYRRWGAHRKLAELEAEFPNLLQEEGDARLAVGPFLPRVASTQSATAVSPDLDTLIRAGQAISSEVMFDRLLDRLLGIVIQNAGAQRGVLLLMRSGELCIEAESSTSSDGVAVLMSVPVEQADAAALCPVRVINYVARTKEPLVIDDALADERFLADPYIQKRDTRSVLCQPVLHRGELIAIVYLENDLMAGVFTPERWQLLALLSGQIAISIRNAEIVENLEEIVRERTDELETRTRLIEQTFGRYTSNEVAGKLLRSPIEQALGGRRQTITILISDLRGFTAYCEKLAPEIIIELLNNYLGEMTAVIQKHNGTIDDFMGDGILALFGAPFQRADDAARAVACALEMQLAMSRVNAWNAARDLGPLEMGIGINTGDVVVGNIGSDWRAKYSAIGNNIALASRIESYTVGGQVLASDATLAAVRAPLTLGLVSTAEPKGVSQPIAFREITGIGGAWGLALPESVAAWTDIDPPRPLSLRRVIGKQIVGEEQHGVLRRLSERRAELRCSAPPPPFADLRLLLEDDGLPPESFVYAKVIGEAEADGSFIVQLTAVPDAVRQHLGRLGQA